MNKPTAPVHRWPLLKPRCRVLMIPNAHIQKRMHRVIEENLSREQAVELIHSLHDYESSRMFCTVNDITDDSMFGMVMPDGEVRVFTIQMYIPGLPVYKN